MFTSGFFQLRIEEVQGVLLICKLWCPRIEQERYSQFSLNGAIIWNWGILTEKVTPLTRFCMKKLPYIIPSSVVKGHHEL